MVGAGGHLWRLWWVSEVKLQVLDDAEVILAKLAETCYQQQLPGHRGQDDAQGSVVSPCGAC